MIFHDMASLFEVIDISYRLGVQNDQYCPSFSFFADLFHLREWNHSEIWETSKILTILYEANMQ